MLYPNEVNKSGTDSNHNLFPENESSFKMSSANDALMLHPDEVDMEIEQSEQREAPETIVANATSNLRPAPMPAAPPSLVKKMSENKEIRTLQARVEELVQSNESSNRRLAYAEMQISEQKRELISMKRRRLDSAGNSVSTSNTARSSSSSSHRDQDYSSNQEEAHQSTLPIKGRLREDLPDELKDPKHSYNWRKQSNSSPLKRAKIIPKLKSMGIDDYILEGMPVNDLMDFICLTSGMLYNTGASAQVPEWVPAEYLTCPPSIAMKKIEALTPAGYFNILRRPHFLSKDRLGVDPKAYHTPDHLPSNDHPVQLIMECRGRYENYRFGTRKAVAAAKDRRENMGSHLTPPHTPSKPASSTGDLRNILPPRKDLPDLRNNIRKKSASESSSVPSLPAKKKEVKMILLPKDPNYRGPGAFSGTGKMDIREREKVTEARRNEKEAEEALKQQTAVRKAAEEEEARKAEEVINSLTAYRDALMKGGGQSSGSRSIMSSNKRTRAPTPSRSPSPSPAPSSSRTPPHSSRKRITARSGKGKERRRSYSRSPSKGSIPREHRPTQKSVPGLYLGKEEARAPTRRREFSPCSPAPRRRTPSSPPRSPQWQTATRRRRDRR